MLNSLSNIDLAVVAIVNFEILPNVIEADTTNAIGNENIYVIPR